MQKKLTVKDILDSKGKNKLAEVYTHYSYEAEACELAGIDMIISSENNDVISIRNAAPNSFEYEYASLSIRIFSSELLL